MRFLCLHGRGTNSDIFETQLSTLFSRISSEHTFDFVDAEFECPAAPGISQLYPPPYLSWHSEYETLEVQQTHDYLLSIIEEDGPYDGVIGFSQGAALAASMLLSSEFREQNGLAPSKNPNLKMAIFFNAVMLFSPSEIIGSNIGKQIERQKEALAGFLQGVESGQVNPERGIESGESISSEDGDNVYDGLQTPSIFGYDLKTFKTRISIPTLHVIGRNDQFSQHSRDLVKLCNPDATYTLFVEGGHELPRTAKALDTCSELLEDLIATVSFG